MNTIPIISIVTSIIGIAIEIAITASGVGVSVELLGNTANADAFDTNAIEDGARGGELGGLSFTTRASAMLATGFCRMTTWPTDANHTLCIVLTGVVSTLFAAVLAATSVENSISATTVIDPEVNRRLIFVADGNSAAKAVLNASASNAAISPCSLNSVVTRLT